jgi:hypothetical protein
MSKEFNAKLDLLIKSEKALLKLEIQKRSKQFLFTAIALVAILVALAMINIAIYLSLEAHYTALMSATLLASFNIAIAILFLMLASRNMKSEEGKSIQEIRNYAWREVSDDINGAKEQVIGFVDGVHKVHNSVDTIINKELFGLKNVIPILQALINMKKSSANRDDKIEEGK